MLAYKAILFCPLIVSPKKCFKQASLSFWDFILNTMANIMYIIRSLWIPWMSIKPFSVNFYPCKHSILQGYSVLRNQQEALVKVGCPWIIHQPHYHSFSGLWSSSFLFLFAYSMQKWRGKAWFISSCEWCQCLTTGRQEKGECIYYAHIHSEQEVSFLSCKSSELQPWTDTSRMASSLFFFLENTPPSYHLPW